MGGGDQDSWGRGKEGLKSQIEKAGEDGMGGWRQKVETQGEEMMR